MKDSRYGAQYTKLLFLGAASEQILPKTLRIDQTWKPGYIGFSHGIGIVADAIRLDQRLCGDPDWQVNHAFILDSPIMDGGIVIDWYVIQAEGHGVTGRRLDGTPFHRAKLTQVAPGGYYEILTPPPDVNLSNVVAFAKQEVGAEYGFFSIASLVITELTPRYVRFDFRQDGSWICSALAAEALRAGGWLQRWPDVYQVRPSQLRAALKS